MMTAKIRKIRSYDLEPTDEASAIREADTGTVMLNRLAMPFNDNARESRDAETSALTIDMSSNEADAPAESRGTMANTSKPARRRGPLVTRWIGYAAHRRQAQARANRVRKLQNESTANASEH